MSKNSSRIVIITVLLGVSFLTGCGVTSTTLPSNLTPAKGGSGSLTISTTGLTQVQAGPPSVYYLQDGIAGRTYYYLMTTQGGSGALSGCTWSGASSSGTGTALPPALAGFTWLLAGASQPNVCVLTLPSSAAASVTPGSYLVLVTASDTSLPSHSATQMFSLNIRNDFTICAGPASGLPTPYSTSCTPTSGPGAATSFPDAVQGRSYGASPLSQIVATNLNGASDAIPAGHPGEFGNGPFTSASSVTGLPGGITSTLQSSLSNFIIGGSAVTGAPNTYSVVVSVTDNPIGVSTQTAPVVPARTQVKTFTHLVHPSLQLAQSLGASWPDAVNGRAYGTGSGCTGGACVGAVYTASNGLSGYVWPSTSPLPPGLAPITGLTCAAATTTYTCSSTSLTAGSSTPGAAPTPFSPSLTVTDTANTATPAATVTTDPQSTRTDSLLVNAPILETLAQASVPGANPASLLPGVVNRSYGVVGAPPSYAASGGLGSGAQGASAYRWCVKTGSLPTGLGPGGVSITTSCPTYFSTGAGSLAFTANPVTGAASTYSFTVQLDDPGNAATPGSVASGTSSSVAATSLIVNPVLAATLTQFSNANPVGPTGGLLPGVANRSYGVINSFKGAPTYSATGGLMVGSSPTYLWCVSAGSLPAGMVGISTNCGLATSTPSNSVQLTANPLGAAGTFPFTVQADDGGNPAVPSTFAVPAADSMIATSVVVHPQIVVSFNFSSPPDAVNGRTYGSPVRTDLIYTVAANQGLAPITMTGTGFPAPIACPTTNGTQQLNCNSGNVAVTGATSAGIVTAADTANAATPAATTGTDPSSQRTTDTLNVRAPLALTPPGGSLAAAVVGRSWGQGTVCGTSGTSACLPDVYTVANGLGGYTPGPVTAGPLSCAFASTGAFSGTYTCSTPSEVAAPPSAVVALTVSDTANATTPSLSANDNSETLPINAELTITPPGSAQVAVLGRAYGTGSGCSGGACQPLTYTVPPATPGLGGPYTFTPDVGTPGGYPAGFSCPTTTNSGNCQAAAVGGVQGSFANLTVTVVDVPNNSTPSNLSTSSPLSMTVNPEMTFAVQPATPYPDAVNPRAYGQGSGCSPTSACSPLVYTIAGGSGLGGYSFTPNNFPASFVSCTQSPANIETCSSPSVTTTASAAPYPNLSVTASDTANPSTPNHSITSNAASVTVHPEMTFSAQPTSPFPTGVVGRRYGSGTGCSPTSACAGLTYTVPSGSGLGGYVFTPNNFPSGFVTCPTGTNSTTCTNSTGVTASPGTTPVNLNVSTNDTANQTTPNNTITSSNASVTIVPEMTVTPPSPSPVTAVTGRAYGAGAGCSGGNCVPLDYKLSSGLGNYTLTGSSLTTSQDTFTCTLTSPNFFCSDAAIAGTVSPATLTFVGAETGNAATPGNTKTDTSQTLTIKPELTVTAPTPAAAVTGRSYGTAAAGCSGGACVALDYKLNNGLGNYTLTGSSLKTAQDTFTCTLTSPNYLCTDAAIAGTTSPATLTFVGAETGNTSTPGNTKTDTSKTLTITPELSVTPPATVSIAVHGRTYGTGTGCTGTGGNCQPLQYSLSNGLGTYTLTGTSLTTPSDTFVCSFASPTFSCSKSGIAGAGGTTPTLTFVGAEAGNASTPGNTKTDATKTLQINTEMSVTPPASVPTAVHNRAYGTGSGCSAGACQPLQYSVSNGLGNYTPTGSSLTDGSDTFALALTSPTYSFSAATIAGAGGSNLTLTFTGAETGNASTPGNTASDTSKTLSTRSQLAVGVPNPTPISDAVTGRPYGTPSGSQDLVYALSSGEGLPPVSLKGTGFPAPITCTTATDASDSTNSMHCNSGGVGVTGATSTGTVTASDTANVSTPAANTTSDPGSVSSSTATTQITVDPEIVIANQNLISPVCGTSGSPCALPNGQLGQPFSVLFTCQAPLGTGTCGGTGSPNNAAATYTWTDTSNNIAGTSFTTTMPVSNPTGDAMFGGAPTSSGSSETVVVSVADDGNVTTPSCTTAATCPSQHFTTNILKSYALVGANGSNTYAVFDTSAGVGGVALVGSAVSPTGGSTPNYLATSSNGTYMFIADPGANQVYLHNAITGADKVVTHTSGLDNVAGDTAAVAVGPQSIPGSLTSPDAVNVYVANAGSDNVQVIDGNPTSGTFGTVVGGPGTFLHGSYPGTGPVDLKVAPTFFISSSRVTHGYVVRQGGNEVCVFDVEPTSANFGKNIAPANSPNTDSCISLGATATYGTPTHIDISPDGLHAFVLQTNGTTLAGLDIIDTNPNSATFEELLGTINLTTAPPAVTLSPNPADGTTTTFNGTYTPTPILPGSLQVVAGAVTGIDNGSGGITGTGISSGTINYATGAISVTFTVAPTTGTLVQVSSTFVTSDPAGVRVSADGQTVWVAGKDTGKLLGLETALVGTTQFGLAAGMSTPTPSTDMPLGIAFRPDAAFGLATLSGANDVLPFTTSAGTAVAATGVTNPAGIDHIANPVLHIVTGALPAATHGVAYASSLVANGPNKYFTFTDLTPGPNNLAGLGFTLGPDGQVTSTSATSIVSTGTFNFTIQVSDQSLPVNNVVQKTISLTIN